jgi:ubiquinone/menaquinone biosynthesis C-methylase UbiE
MTIPTTTRRRYYNNTGDSYESSRYADTHMGGYRDFRNQTLLSILNEAFGPASLRVLEVGCGTGLTLQFLSRTSRDYSLFGIDVSDTMLLQAAEKGAALENRPKLSIGDADRLPYRDRFFDVVFATRFIHQFSHSAKQQLWREFQRVTRKDGLIVLEFYARPYHRLRYYLGGRKGRSAEAYFSHYPTRKEVREIVSDAPQIYPLRLPGARVIASALGENVLRRATSVIGRATGGLLIDEYFVAARNR